MQTLDSNTDAQLILSISLGDHHAFRVLFDKYRDVLFGYSFKFTKSKELSEEALQEVFMKVWQNRESLNPNLSIKSYLFTSIKNYTYNTLRNAAYDHKLKEQIFYRYMHAYNNTEDLLEYQELQAFKDKAVESLPPRRKLIFQMSRVEGLSHEEIAVKLGISPHTVKDQMVKALKSIKKYLQVHTDIAVGLILFIHLFL
ncbi:RNA polymerase sigma-70 factor [Porifericola rhodea]|uniref:RNA polymerase sigma-70 factor n=1 Tax=Porifericola rhodea TaxID=930972 RepID=UPI00266641E2|nr:RNA polymerase sigma-70 factor [Porifericola rhodea]WKN31499.1 RNA polymerase sigma-70 factor [Porifericola rhodea]